MLLSPLTQLFDAMCSPFDRFDRQPCSHPQSPSYYLLIIRGDDQKYIEIFVSALFNGRKLQMCIIDRLLPHDQHIWIYLLDGL